MNSDILECKAEWSWDEAAVISQRLFADNDIIAAEAEGAGVRNAPLSHCDPRNVPQSRRCINDY